MKFKYLVIIIINFINLLTNLIIYLEVNSIIVLAGIISIIIILILFIYYLFVKAKWLIIQWFYYSVMINVMLEINYYFLELKNRII